MLIATALGVLGLTSEEIFGINNLLGISPASKLLVIETVRFPLTYAGSAAGTGLKVGYPVLF
ncbi:hypothetical protein D3C87_2057530 [compost metagenome]